MKIILLALVSMVALKGAAEESAQTLLSADFESGNPLVGWQDIRKNSPPQSRYGALTFESRNEENGGEENRYFSALDPSFGITAPLKEPYEVGPQTLQMIVSARVRVNGLANVVGIDLSSLPTSDFPFQYSNGQGSGFGVRGYQHANESNLLWVYHRGVAPVLAPASTAFVPQDRGNNLWQEWKLIYDNVGHRLTFYLNGQQTRQMENVDLGGTVFHSLWLMGAKIGSDYDDLLVEAVESTSG